MKSQQQQQKKKIRAYGIRSSLVLKIEGEGESIKSSITSNSIGWNPRNGKLQFHSFGCLHHLRNGGLQYTLSGGYALTGGYDPVIPGSLPFFIYTSCHGRGNRQIQNFTSNFGPQHPTAHSVSRSVLEMNGEVVERAEPHIGSLQCGKLVLILDAVHWNPEAPPRTLPRVHLRCDASFSPKSMKKWILPKNRKRSPMPGRGDGKRNGSEERNWGSQCFSTLNEMHQSRDALLLTPQGSKTELNLSLS
ncbi:hypothetical protein M9H77_17381 [Catharanthus roseus]|uniref:Uncharacterized protein n=1 Tax=Catharanthus roseus TaxID=4058 RepID=A0ACC0B4H6_CATRO|nr:hypothetical protein M9H77_17381 [Catharanthus roseus]